MSDSQEFRAWRYRYGKPEIVGYYTIFDILYGKASGLGVISFDRFIGQLDKNRKKIFESDIVKAWIDLGLGGEAQYTFEVKIDPAWGCNIQQWNYNEYGYLPEVLGNTLENPDLLKVDK